MRFPAKLYDKMCIELRRFNYTNKKTTVGDLHSRCKQAKKTKHKNIIKSPPNRDHKR